MDGDIKNLSYIEQSTMPSIDVPRSIDLAYSIDADIEEATREMQENAEKTYKDRQEMKRGIEQTAENTGETILELRDIIDNQNDYIAILKENSATQKKQLQVDEQQLSILKNIFSESSDSVAVEQEIEELILQQAGSVDPKKDFLKDKGGDIIVEGITVSISTLLKAFKLFLQSKGIPL